MAKNEPTKPDDVKTVPENEAPAQEQTTPIEAVEGSGNTPAPEMTDEEAAILAHEGEAVLREMGEEQLEPPAPFDLSDKHIPDPGDVVVPFDKINEILSEKQGAAREAEKTAPEKTGKSEKAAKNQAKRGKAVQQEAQETKTEDTRQEPEKPLAETETKKERKPRAEKQKPATEKKAPAKEETPAPEPERPPEPKEAPRKGEPEQIVYINLSELYAFNNHPFQVRDDEEMRAMVESVKDKGVTQPAIVRPREDGGYEMVSGHRRQKASELAGYFEMPCIVRDLTDEEAITQMVEDNTNQRENILPSERAKALQMQLEAIKKQGARTGNGQRSNEVVAERNKMTVKQVQRYIKLNDLVPDLMDALENGI